MLSPRRDSIEDTEPAVLRGCGSLSTQRYPSSPHLDVFLVKNNGSTNEPNGIVTTENYLKTPLNSTPKLSTFSTFSHHKSGVDLRYRDDPNPYKVSNIEEFKIQTQDPYKTKSNRKLNAINQRRGNGVIPYYDQEEERDGERNGDSPLSSPGNHCNSNRSDAGLSRLSSITIRSGSSTQYENDSLKKFYAGSEASQNSGEYEIPDPDYEDADGSTGGSSEELPLPPPLPHHVGDSSEEYSQLSISTSSHSGGLSPSPLGLHENESRGSVTPIKVSDADRYRIESALHGRKTQVYVADALANLYYKNKPPISTPAQRPITNRLSQNLDWSRDPKYTGVPVLLFDTGETKSRDKRKIQIVLADLTSGLALWKDVIDNLSSYQVVEGDGGRYQTADGSTRLISTFHTMHLSSDHSTVVGLSFDYADSADKFALKLERLTSDFANISLSGAKSKAKKKEAKLQEKNKAAAAMKYVRPKKSDISQPCCFQHVSSLSPNDKNLLSSLHQFISPKLSSGNRSLTGNTSDLSF